MNLPELRGPALHISSARAQFQAKRADFYSKHAKKGLVEEMQMAFAKMEVPTRPELKKYLGTGNERTRLIISDYEGKFGRLNDPQPGEYEQGTNSCADSRDCTGTAIDYLERAQIHERTAASIVTEGRSFMALARHGTGFVKTHFGCGGTAAAHKVAMGTFTGAHDEDVGRIVQDIPRRIAMLRDSATRDLWNARHQTQMATVLLTEATKGNPVYPIMTTWENWGKNKEVDVRWLSTSHFRTLEIVAEMQENAKLLWKMANELGRGPEKQFAHTIFVYDPFRLGRFNDPRVIFDMLPNEAFCVTFDFHDLLQNGKEQSRWALGSVKYAGFHDTNNGGIHGHVHGVGGKGGSRHILILDPDPEVTMQVERAILDFAPEIKEHTRQGELITRAQYNMQTREVTFLD